MVYDEELDDSYSEYGQGSAMKATSGFAPVWRPLWTTTVTIEKFTACCGRAPDRRGCY